MHLRCPVILVTITIISVVLLSCSGSHAEEYEEEIERWRTQRVDRLAQPMGWSSLVGLYWLPEGRSSFGSADSCDLVFPEKAPPFIGVWELGNDSVFMEIAEGIDVRESGSLFTRGPVHSDSHEEPHLFYWKSLYWKVIRRGEDHGVRLWDTLSPARSAVHAIPYFRVDPAWRLAAKFVAADSGETVVFDNVMGNSTNYPIEGRVVGTFRDTAYSIAALDGGEASLFLIISDMTTDLETYPGGRYIYIPRPDSTGSVVVDFNKAYNPPCAFTDFATCLLPPPENYIPFAVRAGEKDYGQH